MTPGPPTEASTKFLSNLMKSNPGLEIRWYVVGAR
jgi:hypothetical protein